MQCSNVKATVANSFALMNRQLVDCPCVRRPIGFSRERFLWTNVRPTMAIATANAHAPTRRVVAPVTTVRVVGATKDGDTKYKGWCGVMWLNVRFVALNWKLQNRKAVNTRTLMMHACSLL